MSDTSNIDFDLDYNTDYFVEETDKQQQLESAQNLLDRQQVQAVEGLAENWREKTGIRRNLSFNSQNSSEHTSETDSIGILSNGTSKTSVIKQAVIQERQNNIRPVVTVDNSLLIKIMDQNESLLEKINNLKEENRHIKESQAERANALDNKIEQLRKDNNQMVLKNEEFAKINERLYEITKMNEDACKQLLVRTKQMLGRETRCMLLSNKICSQCELILTRNDYLIEKQKEILNQINERFEKLGTGQEKLENHLLPECITPQENWLAPPNLGGPLKFSHATFETVNEIDGTVKYHGDLIAQCLNPYLDDLQKMGGSLEDLEDHISRMEKTNETRLKRIETMLEVLYRPNIASRGSLYYEKDSSNPSVDKLYSKSNQNLINQRQI